MAAKGEGVSEIAVVGMGIFEAWQEERDHLRAENEALKARILSDEQIDFIEDIRFAFEKQESDGTRIPHLKRFIERIDKLFPKARE